MSKDIQVLTKEGLFNHPLLEEQKKLDDENPKLNHFAVLDGASIKDTETILPSRTSNYRSLFYRIQEDEYFSEESAPYLIQLDNTLLTWLLEDLYGKAKVSFYQSNKPLDELALHFSQYIVIHTEETEEHEAGEAYLAFYDPRVLAGFIRGLGINRADFFEPLHSIYAEKEHEPDTQLSWMLDSKGICHETSYSLQAKKVLSTKSLEVEEQKGILYPNTQENGYVSILITPYMQNALNQHEQERNIEQMTYDLKKQFPNLFKDKDYQKMISKVSNSVKRMQQVGFASYDKLFTLSAWELHYGAEYEQRDPKGLLASICASPITNEERKFTQFKNRIEQLNLQPEATA